jgi:hypothetical protein
VRPTFHDASGGELKLSPRRGKLEAVGAGTTQGRTECPDGAPYTRSKFAQSRRGSPIVTAGFVTGATA